MEGRRIRGDGLEHEQDYVRERLEEAGDVDEYTEMAQKLKQQAQDLRGLEKQPIASGMQPASEMQPDLDMLSSEANLTTDRMETREGAELDALQNSPVNLQQLPPEAEARRRVAGNLGPGMGDGSLDR